MIYCAWWLTICSAKVHTSFTTHPTTMIAMFNSQFCCLGTHLTENIATMVTMTTRVWQTHTKALTHVQYYIYLEILHILLSVWQTFGSMECRYVCMYFSQGFSCELFKELTVPISQIQRGSFTLMFEEQ
jgi:hypothetical protein